MHGIIRAHVTAIPLVLTAQLIMSAAFVPKTAPCCIVQSTISNSYYLITRYLSQPGIFIYYGYHLRHNNG